MLTLGALLARTRATPGGCRIWLGATSGKGYPQIRLGGKGGGRIVGVHRLVVELTTGRRLTRGRPGARLVAAHDPDRCTSTRCIEPTHLRRTTQGQNIREGRRHA